MVCVHDQRIAQVVLYQKKGKEEVGAMQSTAGMIQYECARAYAAKENKSEARYHNLVNDMR